jgi:hypothetical protein
MAQPKVVLKAAEALGGAPMERNPGVRDRKLVYPETGFPARSPIMGSSRSTPAAARRHTATTARRSTTCWTAAARSLPTASRTPRLRGWRRGLQRPQQRPHDAQHRRGAAAAAGGGRDHVRRLSPRPFCAIPSGMRTAEPEVSHRFREVTRAVNGPTARSSPRCGSGWTEVSRWCRCMGLLGLPGCKLTTTTVATAQKSSTVTARSGGHTVRG